MLKIKTHRFENKLWGRAHLPFFKKFDEYLKKYFDVESKNYNIDDNTFNGKIELISDKHVFGRTPPISDVDCVIENSQTGETKVISFTEYFNHYVCHFAKSNSCSNILLAHFNWHHIYYWLKRENNISSMGKIQPWIFLPFQEYDVESYRNKRKEIEIKDEKLFWLGSGLDVYRKAIRYIEKSGNMQEIVQLNNQQYLERLIKSKIGMSYYMDLEKYNTPFDHMGEFCYRDIEYVSLGLPFIRIEYKDALYDPFIQNKHYISIPRERAYTEYLKNGDEGVANLYIEKYKEVKDDDCFLNYISNNQIEWYDRNLYGDKSYELTFDLLNLKEWVK